MKRTVPVTIDVLVHELYPNTVPERLWMAKSNVEAGCGVEGVCAET